VALDSIIEASLLALGSEGEFLLWNIILEQLCEAKWLLVDSMILL
jgi:hypothetical protein